MADSQSGGVDLQFEWDDDKATSNLEKYWVSFEEAATVFRDPFALISDDEVHSIDEQREIIIGHSTRNRLLPGLFYRTWGQAASLQCLPCHTKGTSRL